MKKTLYALITFAAIQSLLACTGQVINPEKHARSIVNESHSIYIQGGVLKIFSDDEQDILYVYVRPKSIDHWVTAGGGGGKLDNPWMYKSAMHWALGDEDGWYHKQAERKAFSYLFDAQGMTLTTDVGTYAVRRGELIVISLDENWKPGAIESGLGSFSVFDVPDEEREQLVAAVKKHYTGS